MKIMMVCAGGVSTSLLMKKMTKYWREIDEPLEVFACGLADYKDQKRDYDIVLVGPQVSYRLNLIQNDLHKPCAAINSTDYALGDCKNIHQLAQSLYNEKDQADPLAQKAD